MTDDGLPNKRIQLTVASVTRAAGARGALAGCRRRHSQVSAKSLNVLLRIMSDEAKIRETRLRYIRGIVRNRCEYFYDDAIAMRHLRTAHTRFGVSLDALEAMAKGITRWTDFTDGIQDLIYHETGQVVTKLYDLIDKDEPDV